MTDTDMFIDSLGYTLVDKDETLGYLIYHNNEEDKRVEIAYSSFDVEDEDYDADEDNIKVETISSTKDYFGQLLRQPIALSATELRMFLDKLDEMKKEQIK